MKNAITLPNFTRQPTPGDHMAVLPTPLARLGGAGRSAACVTAPVKINDKAENGLTLLELLVVLFTIAILAALLLTGLKGAQNKAKQTICLNNLRQMGLALRQYIDHSLDQTATHPRTGQRGVFHYLWL